MTATRAERTALHLAAGGDETALALAVAHRYYRADESKVAIAAALGISRFQVARLLADARRDGLVRIEIGSPGRVDPELSERVQEALGLTRALVVESHPGSARATTEVVGAALGAELSAAVADGDRVGLTWSRATAVMSRSLRRLRPCTVVQLAGAVSPPDGLPGSVEVARAVAAVAGGPVHTLYAPLLLPDGQTAAGLRRQPEIAATLAQAADLDLAVLAVGAWAGAASAVHDLLPAEERDAIAATGAVGEVSGRLLDADGAAVVTPMDARVLGVALERLRAVPVRLLSSTGAHRRVATRAAVRAGLATVLVVDDELGRALLT